MNTAPKQKLFSLIDKAIFDFSMLQGGDKIVVAVSGGVDSIVLLDYFQNRAKRKENICFCPVFVASNFCPTFSKELEKTINSWGFDLHKIQIDLSFVNKKQKKVGCYWCATKRRAALLEFARLNGYNKIALGHHADDILETFIMNITTKGVLCGMSPKVVYNKYPATIIRPLCYALKDTIKDFAKKQGHLQYCTTCTCQNKDSERIIAKQKLIGLTQQRQSTKYLMLKAILWGK